MMGEQRPRFILLKKNTSNSSLSILGSAHHAVIRTALGVFPTSSSPSLLAEAGKYPLYHRRQPTSSPQLQQTIIFPLITLCSSLPTRHANSTLSSVSSQTYLPILLLRYSPHFCKSSSTLFILQTLTYTLINSTKITTAPTVCISKRNPISHILFFLYYYLLHG